MPADVPQPLLRRQDLLGAWEYFAGGGGHPWTRGVIVFKPYGNDILVERWLPAQGARGVPVRLESLRGACNEAPFGLRLLVRSTTDEKTIDIVKAGDAAISIYFPGTHLGAQLYRRAAHPLAEI